MHSDEYYPFGLEFNSYQRVNSKQNDYLYNGKELQDELDLNWLDYGARMYMPEIGRWGVADKLAEFAYSRTPYRYGFNNPIIFTDPNGLFESRREAREYRKEHGLKGRIRKGSDGIYSINNRKNSTATFKSTEYGVVTGALVETPREDGKLSNLEGTTTFIYDPLASLERGNLDSNVPAIIMHRTVSRNGSSLYNQWKSSSSAIGTHFLVGEDGTIYQAASLKKHTTHLYNSKKQMYEEYFGKLLNSNTVGIKVIGGYNDETKTWDELTPEQISAVAQLVLELSYQLDLDISDILPHEKVQRKTPGEGQVVIDAIINKVIAEW